jgi:hypothetical protein
MPGTAYTDNLIATAKAHGASYQGPATVYIAMVSTTPSKTVAGTIVQMGAVDVATISFAQTGWTNDGAGNLQNTNDINGIEATGDFDDDVVAVEFYDNASPASGNRLEFIILSTPRTFTAGMTPKFLAGDLKSQVA